MSMIYSTLPLFLLIVALALSQTKHNMQNAQTPTPGVSLRRSACDRCRGQKLRCLREHADPEGRCDRCAKADAQCLTSPIYRMRNYSAKDHSLAGASRKRPRPGPESSTQPPQSLGLQTPSTASVSTPFEWPSMDAFAKPNDTSRPPSLASLTYDSLVDFTGPSLFGSASLSDAVNAWDNGDPSSLLSAKSPLTMAEKTASKPDIPAPSAQPEAQSQDVPWLPYREGVSGHSSQENLSPLNSDTSYDTQDYMVELSSLNLSLVSQLKRMTKGLPFVDIKSLISLECASPNPNSTSTSNSVQLTTPLEDILNSTRRYLDILSLVAGSRPPLPISTYHVPRVPASDGSNKMSSERSSISSDNSTDSSVSSSPASTQPQHTPQPDSTTLILLITCYIHILRLNVALFLHIQQYLQALSETDEPTINPLPGLYGFSDFPLQSGNLQATMVIQLATNMFERIETLLGLPREFRIGTREDGHDGLLKTTGFIEIAKMLLHREDEGPPELGKGGIKSLKKDMKRAKRLLRGRIAP